MQKINTQRRWTPVPGDEESAVLLSPLTVRRRAALIEQATTTEGKGRTEKRVFDSGKFQDLVADECIHGLKGFVCDDGEGTPLRPVEFTKEIGRGLMDVDAFNAFVFRESQAMGLVKVEEAKKAGNA